MSEKVQPLTYKEAAGKGRWPEHSALNRQVICTQFYTAFQFEADEMAHLVSKINFGVFWQILQIFMGPQIRCMIEHLFV